VELINSLDETSLANLRGNVAPWVDVVRQALEECLSEPESIRAFNRTAKQWDLQEWERLIHVGLRRAGVEVASAMVRNCLLSLPGLGSRMGLHTDSLPRQLVAPLFVVYTQTRYPSSFGPARQRRAELIGCYQVAWELGEPEGACDAWDMWGWMYCAYVGMDVLRIRGDGCIAHTRQRQRALPR
jgi:hypothetical protein